MGGLRLDYSYQLDGKFTCHCITFDHPENDVTALKWLGQGPFRVWQNRLRGTSFGVHEISRNDIQAGQSWDYPEFQGYFAGLRWARLATAAGPLTVSDITPGTYLRVGTPRINHPMATVSFPAGDLSFLQVIPAIGSKFVSAEQSGPASQAGDVAGLHCGSLVFRLDD